MDDKKFLILLSAAAAFLLVVVVGLLLVVLIDSRGPKDAADLKLSGASSEFSEPISLRLQR